MNDNKKLCNPDSEGQWRLRIWRRKATKRKAEHLSIKCGCCDEKLSVYVDQDWIEINGVHASRKEWALILGL